MQSISHIFKALYVCIVCLMLTCCSGNSDEFRISGTVAGNPTMNMRAVYYGNDALQTVITPVRDGKFDFFGNSRVPTIVYIYNNDYNLLGCVYAKNGDDIECKLTRGNPYKIEMKGSEINEQWAKWLAENEKTLSSKNTGKINSAVKKFVETNKDNVLSTILVLTAFDSFTPKRIHQADSLLSLLSAEARPQSLLGSFYKIANRVVDSNATQNITSLTFTTRTDSIYMYIPSKSFTLLSFSNELSGRPDSIVPALRRLNKHPKSKLEIIDFSLDTDTFTWARTVVADSAKWIQAWRPGGIMATGVDRLALPRLPYFIVADSAGKQLLRTPSVTEAENFIKKNIKD